MTISRAIPALALLDRMNADAGDARDDHLHPRYRALIRVRGLDQASAALLW